MQAEREPHHSPAAFLSMVTYQGDDMNTNVWLYREPLSDDIKFYLERLAEHLKRSEYNQLIEELETHLGTYLHETKIQKYIKNATKQKEKIKSAMDKTQKLLVEVNEILSEQYGDAVKMYLLENDEDRWLKLKTLELDIPNHLDSLDEIFDYLIMLDSLKDIAYSIHGKNSVNPRHVFFCHFKKTLNDYGIEFTKYTKNKSGGNESRVHRLYRLIMKQVGVKTKEFDEFKQDCNS